MTTLFAAFSPSRMLPLVWWQALGDSTTSHQFYAKGTGFHCGSASSSKSPPLSTRRCLDTLPVTWLTTAKDPCLCDLEILLPIYLLNSVCRVIQHSHDNRMMPQNLAIVFGPTLMSSTASENLAVNIVYQGQLVEFMIIETNALFLHWLVCSATEAFFDA